MAHCARLDENNVVVDVRVVSNDIADPEAWCESLYDAGRWKQTSYSGAFRGKFAGLGDLYDEALDVFYTPGTPIDLPAPIV